MAIKFKRNTDGTLALDVEGNPVIESGAASQEEIQAQVQALADQQLAEIKKKLDGAFSARDEAVRKAAELEEAQKTAKMEALTAAGKTTEVLEMKLQEALGKLDAASKKVIGYERDGTVRDALRSAGVEFRNERAEAMAFREVVDSLVQDANGQWVHKTGAPIKDFITTFSKDEENSYLFKQKQNSGAGSGTPGDGAPKLDPNKKLTEMTTAEVLAAAAKGQLGNFKMG
jgi:hypothetical protein